MTQTAVKETGIIMSGSHPLDILEGRKTMTRRVITADNSTVCGYGVTAKSKLWTSLVWDERVYVDHGPHILHPSSSQYLHVPWVDPEDGDDHRVFRVRCKYDIGDRLWVRETWAAIKLHDNLAPRDIPRTSPIWYRAKEEARIGLREVNPWPEGNIGKWRPSIFMPRWASRILLEITDVRAERLQEINIDDMWAEGMDHDMYAPTQFKILWDSLNAKRGYPWEGNWWVWPITYARYERATV